MYELSILEMMYVIEWFDFPRAIRVKLNVTNTKKK